MVRTRLQCVCWFSWEPAGGCSGNVHGFSGVALRDLLPLQLLHQASLQVNTDLDALAPVLEWFNQFHAPPISYEAWLHCQLALAEGFTNAVRHAHCGLPLETPITMEVQVFATQLEMRIWDCGQPFDLQQALESMPQDLDTEAEGGRGLRLMQRIADILTYCRTADDRNCLLIVKKY